MELLANLALLVQTFGGLSSGGWVVSQVEISLLETTFVPTLSDVLILRLLFASHTGFVLYFRGTLFSWVGQLLLSGRNSSHSGGRGNPWFALLSLLVDR